MPARHPHRLAHKCGMPRPRTPGQPNSFSVYSVPSVAQHPSAIPSVPQYPFRKNKAKNNMEKDAPPIHIYPHCHTRPHPEPKNEKQTQSTPFNMDSGVVPSEWNESRELPFGWTNYEKQTQ